jgi:hypothetical protein
MMMAAAGARRIAACDGRGRGRSRARRLRGLAATRDAAGVPSAPQPARKPPSSQTPRTGVGSTGHSPYPSDLQGLCDSTQ